LTQKENRIDQTLLEVSVCTPFGKAQSKINVIFGEKEIRSVNRKTQQTRAKSLGVESIPESYFRKPFIKGKWAKIMLGGERGSRAKSWAKRTGLRSPRNRLD